MIEVTFIEQNKMVSRSLKIILPSILPPLTLSCYHSQAQSGIINKFCFFNFVFLAKGFLQKLSDPSGLAVVSFAEWLKACMSPGANLRVSGLIHSETKRRENEEASQTTVQSRRAIKYYTNVWVYYFTAFRLYVPIKDWLGSTQECFIWLNRWLDQNFTILKKVNVFSEAC